MPSPEVSNWGKQEQTPRGPAGTRLHASAGGTFHACNTQEYKDNNRETANRAHLRPTGATKDLTNVQHAQVHEAALLRRVHLRAFDDHGVGGQVYTPR